MEEIWVKSRCVYQLFFFISFFWCSGEEHACVYTMGVGFSIVFGLARVFSITRVSYFCLSLLASCSVRELDRQY